jgi:hypothetical protein
MNRKAEKLWVSQKNCVKGLEEFTMNNAKPISTIGESLQVVC